MKRRKVMVTQSANPKRNCKDTYLMKSRWNSPIGSCLKNLARMSCCEFSPFPFVPFALPLRLFFNDAFEPFLECPFDVRFAFDLNPDPDPEPGSEPSVGRGVDGLISSSVSVSSVSVTTSLASDSSVSPSVALGVERPTELASEMVRA